MFDDLTALSTITTPDVIDEIARWTPKDRQHVDRIVELVREGDYTRLVRHIQRYPARWYMGPRAGAVNLAVRLRLLPADPTVAIERLARVIRGYKDGEDLARSEAHYVHHSAKDLLRLWRA